jgi:hypothetical protein
MTYAPPKTIRTTNKGARQYVQAKLPFTNSNGQLYAVRHTPMLYVVYSYGDHWPLFLWDGLEWYVNEDRCSVTTSRHHSYAHPLVPTTRASTQHLRERISMIRNAHHAMEKEREQEQNQEQTDPA